MNEFLSMIKHAYMYMYNADRFSTYKTRKYESFEEKHYKIQRNSVQEVLDIHMYLVQ